MKRLFIFLSILFLVGCSTNASLIEIKKQNKNLFDSKSNSEYFAECLKEYISHHDEKISMFLSYMKKVDHKILKKK